MKKLAIVCTHPIQYYAPVFKLLSERKNIAIKVFYTGGAAQFNQFDKGFNQPVQWDIPLLDGYPHLFLKNTSKAPGTHHFSGIKNPAVLSGIAGYQPDAILVYGWAWGSHLSVIRYFHGKLPVWFRGDSNILINPSGIKALLKSTFLKWVYKNIDRAFYVGTNNKAYFLKYGLKPNQLTFAPHAIDNNRFATGDPENRSALRKQLNIGDDDILLLFAGKFEQVKNPLLLLSAFQKLQHQHVQILFVGNGELDAKLKTQCNGNKKVHFLGFQNQSEMPGIYQACDLFCMPSERESWGLAINEAMAAGKAILAADTVGAATDLIQPEENGAIFRAGNLDDLYQKLAELCKNKTTLLKYGKASQEIIKRWTFLEQAITFEQALLNK